jgi:hypothetical protein
MTTIFFASRERAHEGFVILFFDLFGYHYTLQILLSSSTY